MLAFRALRFGALGTDKPCPAIVTRHVPGDRVLARPLRVGARMLDLFGMPDDWLPSDGMLPGWGSSVHTIADALVFSSSGIVGFTTGQMIEDTLDHTDPHVDRYERRGGNGRLGQDGAVRAEGGTVLVQAPTRELPGRYLSLLLGSYANHFHWLVMSLARIVLLTTDDLAGLKGVLVPADLGPAQLDALRLAKQTARLELYPVQRGEGVRVGSLLLPWNIASGAGVNPAAASFLRGLAAQGSNGSNRRLYIDRRGSAERKLLNEDEIVAAVRTQHVEPVRMEGLSMNRQSELMRCAELIIGPHGAGLANMVFARPGARVVELMPLEAINWCYRHLAAACGHDYDCVVGRSVAGGWIASGTHVLSAVSHCTKAAT